MFGETNIGVVTMIIQNTRELGGFLRQAREDAGLTQAELAARLNVRRQRVLYLEQGEGQILMGFVFAVMRALGVELVLQKTDDRPSSSVAEDRCAAIPAPYSIDDIANGGLG
jgi:HTH-type transcriptional regulator / antitoxin HipB